jgi:excisionase family DNA binding protein
VWTEEPRARAYGTGLRGFALSRLRRLRGVASLAQEPGMSARAYTVASLAQEWECSEGVIRKLVASGQLGSFRIGALIRIPAEAVQRFECPNIASNDSAAGSRSSTATGAGSGTASVYTPPTAQERRRKLASAGGKATAPLGRLAG